MQIKIRKIGNSNGIIIPQSMLQECNISNEAEISISKGNIVVKPVRVPRQGWEEAIKTAGVEKEDTFMDGIQNEFDNKEWTW